MTVTMTAFVFVFIFYVFFVTQLVVPVGSKYGSQNGNKRHYENVEFYKTATNASYHLIL